MLIGAHGAYAKLPFGDAAFFGDFGAFTQWRINLSLRTTEAEENNE